MTGQTAPTLVVDLADPACTDPTLSGAKAANIARAAVAGLATLPGFALTTSSFDPDDPDWSAGAVPPAIEAALRPAWSVVSGDGAQPLVVRSSSTVEDIGESSMAGQFRSVLDVFGWTAFIEAVRAVLGSAKSAVPGGDVLPMAVLVQQQLDARCGGVAFGIDPVTGDPRHYLIEAVEGGPEQLVSGTVTARRYVVDHRGRIKESDPDVDPSILDRHDVRAVARLVHRAGRAFDRPQDIEWAFDQDGKLWLLQSRPVTATGELVGATGPLLGPGPVGETFPEPLRPLEDDLWIAPLREGIRRAIALSGVVSRHRLSTSPVVTLMDGRVAADLDLFGYTPTKRSGWRWLDPRPGARRLMSAWRIGQVRGVLSEQIADVLRQVDADLSAVPPLGELDDDQLVGLIDRCRGHLVGVHGHEVLAGTLLQPAHSAGDVETGPTAAALALAIIAEGAGEERDDAAIIAEHPVVLALVPARVGEPPPLPPPGPPAGTLRADHRSVSDLGGREALRLRARWLQELSARAATELAYRLHRRRVLLDVEAAAYLGFDELVGLLGGAPAPADLPERVQQVPGPPLPSAFRRSANGAVAPVRRRGAHRSGGRGAGGGRGEGVVVHASSTDRPGPGDVLVVRVLSPRLAVHLPVLAGLIAETGSVLSHLAILAREFGVPTVVAVHDALHRYPTGTHVLVDGETGEITVLDEPATERDIDASVEAEEESCTG
jgi:pyruvate,water dikinase